MSQQENSVNKNIIIIILCAGEGSRLSHITQYLPKPLIKINILNNTSILENLLDNLQSFKVEKIVIIKGYLGDKIDEMLRSLNLKNKSIINNIVSIDAEKYKLGPLFSFLSITKEETLFKNNYYYMVLPGDTIFQFELLKWIYTFLINYYKEIKDHPVVFFRKTKAKHLLKLGLSKKISIIDIIKTKNYSFLKEIRQIEIKNYSGSESILQIIPIFFIPYDFINRIKEDISNFGGNTIREMINYSLKLGKEVLAIRTNRNLYFQDIDYEEDIDNLKLKKKKKKGQ